MCSAIAAVDVTDPTPRGSVEPATEPRVARTKRKTGHAPETINRPRIIRAREAARRVGVSVTTIRRLEAQGEFPVHVEITPFVIGYVEDEVEEYIDRKIAARYTA